MQTQDRSPESPPGQPRLFSPFFLLFCFLTFLAGLLADPRLLARLFSSHARFSDDIVQAVQTLRLFLAGAGGLGAVVGILLYRYRPAGYRILNNALLNTLLFVCTLGVSLVMAEGILRWVDPWGVSQFREARLYFARATVTSEQEHLGYVHKPSFQGTIVGVPVKINPRGLRDRDLPYENTGSMFRILCLGDSVTFGWGIPEKDTFVQRLETLLNRDETPERFQVINAGVGGHNTRQEAALYAAETQKYGADLVLLFFTINDAALPLPIQQATPVDPSNRLGNLTRVLGEVFKRVFATLYGFMRYMTLPKVDYLADYRAGSDQNWRQCMEAIGSIRDLAHKNGSEFALFVIPAMQDLQGEYPYGMIHKRLADFCKKEGVPLFDLLDDFRGKENMEVRISIFDGHPNRFAHDLIARAVEVRLAEAGLIPVPRETERLNPNAPGRRP